MAGTNNSGTPELPVYHLGVRGSLHRPEITDKQHAHALVDRVPADPMTAAVRFLEFLLLYPVDRALATGPAEDEEISEEEEQAVARSKEWFQQQRGIPFGQAATNLGFTIQIRSLRRVFSRLAEGSCAPLKAGLKSRAG